VRSEKGSTREGAVQAGKLATIGPLGAGTLTATTVFDPGFGTRVWSRGWCAGATVQRVTPGQAVAPEAALADTIRNHASRSSALAVVAGIDSSATLWVHAVQWRSMVLTDVGRATHSFVRNLEPTNHDDALRVAIASLRPYEPGSTRVTVDGPGLDGQLSTLFRS
jgi:hypothetical protein